MFTSSNGGSSNPRSYLRALRTYLISFTKRSQPLVDVESQQREAEEQFNKAWEESELAEEWQDAKLAKATAGANGEGGGIWCTACKYSLFISLVT